MATVDLTTEQVLELLRQLPADRKREALAALATAAPAQRDQLMGLAESRLRQIAQQRGLEWDSLSDDQREALVDDLLHEDRSCGT